jgi:hypothetical protein
MPVIPGSVPLGGFIAPYDPNDTYAVQDSIYGRGGLHEVADTAARNAITADRRRAGMLVCVQADGSYWRLLAAPWTMGDADWIPFTGSATTTYLHTQGIASTVWNITHPLGGYPSLTIRDSGGNTVEGEIFYVSVSQITLTFSYPISGVAQLN